MADGGGGRRQAINGRGGTGIHYSEVPSSVLPITAISLILSLSSCENLKVKSVDLSQETCSGCQPFCRICNTMAQPHVETGPYPGVPRTLGKKLQRGSIISIDAGKACDNIQNLFMIFFKKHKTNCQNTKHRKLLFPPDRQLQKICNYHT